ncbi:MAG: heavy metal translocating P-type ATPase [Gammaproteobacteria bacterium]
MNNADCCASSPPPPSSDESAEIVDPGERTILRIDKMDCPTEEALIRGKLAGMPGIHSLQFNLVQRTLVLNHTPESLAPAMVAIGDIGMEATLASQEGAPKDAKAPAVKSRTWLLVAAVVAAVAAEAIHWFDNGNHGPEIVLSVIAIFSGGWPTYKKGWIALKNFNLNINALMSIAVTGAALIGEWPEAAMVIVLFALAELIESKSLDRARNAIDELMSLAPDTATVRQTNGSWMDVEAKTVPVGARVRVKPGERIALDGEVVVGRSSVDQSPITGESLPVEKDQGDPVFAGTINESGSFEFRVTASSANSTLARITRVVEEAQGAKAPTQRFVDRFSRIYTPAVFVLALAVALVPPLLFGAVWLAWIYKALVLLVIACPCALVISTPVTLVSGLAAAARHGILIKGGVYLEEGRRLTVIALDKTGTLTHGKPAQTDFEGLTGEDESKLRIIAASLASRSDHPVSKAISRAAQRGDLAAREVSDFTALNGRGVRGRVDGQLYQLGNHRLVEEMGLCSPALEAKLEALEVQGKTVVLLMNETQPIAVFAVADTVKDSSRAAIAELHALSIKTIMLTGDNSHTAAAIARQVGIDEARGNLLPEDKLKVIESLAASNDRIGMVGDGINDAPALARADIGFAMGAAGTDTALETADVAIMDDDLSKIVDFIALSRATSFALWQNIAIALAIKAVFLVLTLTGQATLWMAVFADMGASLIVVANGLRLVRYFNVRDCHASSVSLATRHSARSTVS